MGLGGVILAGVGIMMTVLVANGRWPATWDAIIGNGGAAGVASSGHVADYNAGADNSTGTFV